MGFFSSSLLSSFISLLLLHTLSLLVFFLFLFPQKQKQHHLIPSSYISISFLSLDRDLPGSLIVVADEAPAHRYLPSLLTYSRHVDSLYIHVKAPAPQQPGLLVPSGRSPRETSFSSTYA
jgi:hypothetical protein